MSQHDYVIANGTGAAVRSDLNNALAAIVSNNSGSTEPTTTYAYQWWADTTANQLKLRNAANSAWITIQELDGTMLMEAGSAASPGLAFASDLDTGLFSAGTNALGIATNGVERVEFGTSEVVFNDGGADVDFRIEGDTNANLFFVDAGNDRVGIGTSSPHATFQVHDGAFVLSKPASGSERNWRILPSDAVAGDFGIQQSTTVGGTTYATKVTIGVTGNVGIGTTSPNANSQLHIVGSSYQPLYVNTTSSDGGGAAFLRSGTQALFVGTAGGSWLTGSSTADGLIRSEANLIFAAGGNTQRAQIDSSGRLLVGTSSARDNFYNTTGEYPAVQIEGTDYNKASLALTLDVNTITAPRIVFGKTRGGSIGSNTIVQSGDQVGVLSFQGSDGTNLVDAARIQCEVDGTPGADDMPGRLVFSVTQDGQSAPTEAVRINHAREVLINRTSPITFSTNTTDGIALLKNRIDVSAASLARITQTRDATGTFDRFYSGSSIVGEITTNGTNTTYATSSDYRLKENVVPLTGAVDRLNQLQVHRFNFIADPDKTVDGFIAHEAQVVVPECVTGTKDEVDADGNPVYQGIDQSKLVPLLTAALQEAIGEIESLKARVAALESA
jgi:hypothetical protein